MKNNIFRKKFNDLGPNVSDKIDKIFEGETKSDSEFVAKFKNLSSKARKKAIQIAGAGLVSLLVLSGFTGCVDKNGNITETTIDQAPEPQETPTSVLNEYTTVSSPSQTNKPQESTSAPTETTGRPEESTTARPAETTTAPTEITTTAPATEETTTEAPIVTPVEPEKLPGYNEDYVYPTYLLNWVSSHYTNSKIKILYVEPLPYQIIYDMDHGFYIYVECTDLEDENDVSYSRLAFELPSKQDSSLGRKREYSSYSDYINTLVDYMQNYQVSNVKVSSSAVSDLRTINNMDMSKFAKFLGDQYVDAKILYTDRRVYAQNDTDQNKFGRTGKNHIVGFVYTADGKCECFNILFDFHYYNLYNARYASLENKKFLLLLQDMADGTRTKKDTADWNFFETYTRPIEDVFTQTNQSEQTEQSTQ